jgi:phosphoglycerate kinase
MLELDPTPLRRISAAMLNSTVGSDEFSYVSTAGGAFLEWLEGLELPGVVALAVK